MDIEFMVDKVPLG